MYMRDTVDDRWCLFEYDKIDMTMIGNKTEKLSAWRGFRDRIGEPKSSLMLSQSKDIE